MFLSEKKHGDKIFATIALTTKPDTAVYGTVTLQGGRITQFIEKTGRRLSVSQLENIFPRLAEEGRLSGFSFTGAWHDISYPQ